MTLSPPSWGAFALARVLRGKRFAPLRGRAASCRAIPHGRRDSPQAFSSHAQAVWAAGAPTLHDAQPPSWGAFALARVLRGKRFAPLRGRAASCRAIPHGRRDSPQAFSSHAQAVWAAGAPTLHDAQPPSWGAFALARVLRGKRFAPLRGRAASCRAIPHGRRDSPQAFSSHAQAVWAAGALPSTQNKGWR